jgi:MFS family permease
MLQSRVFTPAFRFFAGLAVFALVAAFVVGFSSAVQSPIDRVLGPLTLGWKGGVGNHLGYIFFVGLFGLSAGLAGILVAFRDADAEAEAQVVHTESVPLTRAPVGPNFMPALAAFGFVLMLVGLATQTPLYATVGLVVALVAGFVWTLRTWAERATGDDGANAELYHRFIDPLRTPVIAILSIAVVAIGLSRVLLAVSKTSSVLVFGVVAAVFFIVAAVLALRPSSARSVTTVLVIIGAIAVIIAGVLGAVSGERKFEEHSTEQGALPAATTASVIVTSGVQQS